MAFKSNDGKSFGNRQKMNAYNSRSKPDPETPGGGMDVDGDQDGDIESVVAQDGPASKVEISHEGGKHSVTSHHGGHKHHSEHGSAEEAHMHGAKAAGIQEEPQEQAGQMGGYGGEDVGVM